MTVTVRDQIELNGYKYKIKGAITGGWIDPFPEQFTLGDPDYSNRRDLSSWIINCCNLLSISCHFDTIEVSSFEVLKS